MRSGPLANVFGWAAAIALAQGCTSETAAVTRASTHAQRHLPAFVRFDRWAQRVAAGEGDEREGAALSELLFAPARNAPDLVAAFVVVSGRSERSFALPSRAALGPVRDWVALRDPSLGTVHAAIEERCPIDGPAISGRTDDDPPCVLLTTTLAKDERPLAITMAFRDGP